MQLKRHQKTVPPPPPIPSQAEELSLAWEVLRAAGWEEWAGTLHRLGAPPVTESACACSCYS